MCHRCTWKCFKKAIQNIAEANGDLTGRKIANKITKVSRNLPQNNPKIVTNEVENTAANKKYLKKIYISRKKAKKYWWSKINIFT